MLSKLNSCLGALLLMGFILVGCRDTGQQGLSVDELTGIFQRHNKLMDTVIVLCQQYSAIRRVGIEPHSVSYYGDVNSTAALDNAEKQIRSAIRLIGAVSIHCGRRGDFDDNPLAVVSFVLYASGLSVSGSQQAIVYKTAWSLNHNPLSEVALDNLGFKPLHRPKWVIYESR